MVKVADIAKDAFDAVAAEVEGVIQTATLTRVADGSYDPATGDVTPSASQDTGRAVIATTTKLVEDVFGPGEIGPTDELIYLEGLTRAPLETDEIVIGALKRHIRMVRDIAGSGGLYAVVAR